MPGLSTVTDNRTVGEGVVAAVGGGGEEEGETWKSRNEKGCWFKTRLLSLVCSAIRQEHQ